MIREEINQSWVTLAVTDMEALDSIYLAMSLKKVGTKRKVWIVISESVTPFMKYLLLQVFHGILRISNAELKVVALQGEAWNTISKLWCWRLHQYEKCVFLKSNYLVKKNCDELFKNDEFSAFPDASMSGRFDTSCFVFKPSCDTFEKLLEFTGTVAQGKEQDVLNDLFKYWTPLDGQISSSILMDDMAINQERQKFHSEFLNSIFKDQQDESIQNFISDMMENNNVPKIYSPCIAGGYQPDIEDTIAVVGMSCRFPGANNTTEYWKLLSEGREAIRRFPIDRPFTGPQEAREMQAGFLNCPVDEFDAKFFGISPREAALVDPQQRLLLEVTWECLENAGINPQTLRDSDTGVYVGLWQQDYERIIMESKRTEDDKGTTDFLHVFLGNKYSATASRISFCLGLNGPAVAVESGCSSSLTGLHLACESLHNGETSLALVSGVNLILLPFNPFSGKAADENGVVLSRDYRCKTFDESADGFVRAEACGVVALKRYVDARRDGDNILAIIKGTAINNDGSGTSFGTPNEKAQEKVYRAALKRAKLRPAEVSYVEAHGTGTVVGDPIEMYAVGQAYSEGRTEPLLVGSVKTNIGHCEAAAGIASLIKVILCIQNEAIPPHLNLKTLNPRINLESIPAKIPMELTPWTNKTKIAAISSFSMSATNAHAIVQQPPKQLRMLNDDSKTTEVITLSAKSEEALSDLTKKYIDFLKSNGNISLIDIAYGANTGRAQLQHRLAVVASDTNQLLSRLEKQNVTQGKASTLKSKVAFLFTGQGSQYIGMTKGLYETFPAFRYAMDRCNAMFEKNLNESLQNVILKNDELLNQTLYCQPAIFCIEYCLFQLWSHFGIRPDCVLGHSVGEFAAAVCANILTLEDAMKLVIARSKLVHNLSAGSMLAVRATQEDVTALIKIFSKAHKDESDIYIDIAAINSSEEVVVSGTSNCVKQFQDFVMNNAIKYVNIHASHAFHSQAMDPVLSEFGKIAETAAIGQPICTYVSGTLAKAMDPIEFGPEYWQRHLRDTVRFSEAIKVVWSECKVLVEIGSQPILLGLAMANIEDSSNAGVFCPSQRRNEEPTASFYTAMKRLYVSGVDFDWASVYGVRQKSVILPTYPFQRQRYWISDDVENEDDVNPLLHPLLGKQFYSPIPELIFTQIFRLKELSYIEDHKVAEFIVVPAAALLETFLAAGREVLQGGARNKFTITIENFVVEAVLPLANKCNIQTLVKSDKQNPEDGLKYQLSLNRKLENHFDKWKSHASAEFRPSSKMPEEKLLDLESLKSRLEHKKSLESSYKTLADIGIQFGPKFQSITSAWFSSTEILAEISLPEDSEDYVCHPIVLDAMIQACAFREYLSKTPGADDVKNDLFLPISIKKFTWLTKSFSSTLIAHSSGDTGIVILYNSDGEQLAIMEGLELLKTTINSVTRAIRADSLEVPDFLCDNWRKTLGKTDSRVDITRIISPNLESPTVKPNKDTIDDIDPAHLRESLEAIDTITFYIFLISIQECNWTWPNPGDMLTVQIWKPFLPSSFNEGIIQMYMNELEVRGYLEYIEPGMSKVLKALPNVVECDTRIVELRTRSSSNSNLSSSITQEFPFLDRFRTCLPDILQGKLTPLAYLFPEDGTEAEYGAEFVYTKALFYKHQNILVLSYFEDTIANFRDNQSKDGILRILEVGSGSGSTTALCLAALKRLNIPFHYTFTDIAATFVAHGKKKLGEGPELSYQVFDIEKDPLMQGLSPEQFDIVIGVQVIHATINIVESLRNLKTVLKRGGSLILGEGFEPHTFHLFIFGMLEGWWRFKDVRLDGKLTALLGEQQWADCLSELGFDGISSAPGIYLGVVSGRNASQEMCISYKLSSPHKKWLVITDSSQTCSATCTNFQANDRDVIEATDNTFEYYRELLNAEFGTLEGMIYFCTVFKSQNIVEIQHEIVPALLNFLKAYEVGIEKYKVRPKIVVVTRGVYSIDDTTLGDPNGATAWGMMKVFFNENHNSRLSCIDLDPCTTTCEAGQLFSQIWNTDEELFVAFRQNKTFVLRCNYNDKPPLPIQLPNTDRFKFMNPESGTFTDIEIRPAPQIELNEDDVEIEVRACALNFRDLFMVMKPDGFVMPEDQSLAGGSMESVGLDVAGVVSSIGSKVTRFQVGDEVFGFARNGALGTHTLAADTTVMKMPKDMTFVEASTVPCAFMTVLVSLVNVGKITREDRVLIHVASGGVGLAAIQVVKSVGCKIFATAGNKRKRAYLRNLGIKYVYHSRNTSYGDGIQRDTNGEGVTVVLNSLTGPNFKETSLRVCSQGARFIEIAKMNIWQPEEVAALRPDVQYTIVDLSLKDSIKDGTSTRKVDAEGYTSKIEKLVNEGTYKGLPCVTYPLSKVRDAFYYFQKAKHIGKIVVEIPHRTLSESGRFEHKHYIFNDKSSYMITGGMGGIGVEVTKWMRTVGAKTVILVGRSEPTEIVQRLIDEWNRQGSSIVVFQTDIAEEENCVRLLNLVKKLNLPPLRGIFHAAGVISDAAVSKQTVENFEYVLRPKVFGAWYLHQLTMHYQMEFFIMFSSLSGIVGMLGQCNHSAANRFLDSLTHYRVSMGLPGKTINWGGWSDIGAAAQIALTTEVFSGMRMFTPAQGIAALEKIMTSHDTQIGVSEVTNWNLLKNSFGQGRYMDEIMTDKADAKKFEQFDYLIEEIKQAVTLEERQLKIQIYIEAILKQTLSLPSTDVLDIDQNFNDLGVDSLMGMEMKNRFQSILGEKTLSISSMQENRTIRSLSSHLAYLMENEPLDTRPVEELIKEDVLLPVEIQPADIPATMPSKFSNVLLTGATGHLGIHCLAELLDSQQELTVHCLVRGKSDAEAQERLQKALDRYRISTDILDRVKIIAGDITKDKLGVTIEDFESLASTIDGIIHIAAKVNHVDKYSDGSRHDMRTHNVHGMVNVLKFASSHKTKSVLFASTLFSATKITESGTLGEEYPEKDDMGESINWGYLQSKFIAEKLAREAAERGIPVTTLRFPVIFGNSVTGHMPTGYNHVWSTILASIRVRMIPSGHLNGIPIIAVDSAAKVTTKLFLSDSAERGLYNLTVNSTLSEEILANGLSEYGITCEFVPFKEWKDAVFEEADAAIMGPLKTLYQDEDQQSGIYSLHSLSRDTDKINISSFSEKMLKNLPHAPSLVVSPELVVWRQLRAYFQSTNKS